MVLTLLTMWRPKSELLPSSGLLTERLATSCTDTGLILHLAYLATTTEISLSKPTLMLHGKMLLNPLDPEEEDGDGEGEMETTIVAGATDVETEEWDITLITMTQSAECTSTITTT